ncbi:hypothetical protein [Luteibacter yeojuensis]|uniref:Uncharacterized protein n=1 Tax=Luteibacter yeojuensis TaxID=345309 RepID=A0A7X5QS60_9GAMM|nr:hypothetical protein [Luteibacter yeojuensis]NID14408.1 hypothetical protein [Luteibacter yeojuensis]
MNADGVTVQIDDTYANLAVVEMGTIATNTATSAGGNSGVTFSRSGLKNPLIAVAGSTSQVAVAWLQNAGSGTWGFNIAAAGGVGTQCKYLIFDNPPASNPNYGFQVFDSSGNKTFDGSLRYLRVVDMQVNISDGAVLNYDASKQYAVCHLIFGFRVWNQTGFNQVVASRASGGSVTLNYITINSVPGSPPQLNAALSSILVVDITNYGL